MSFVNDDTTASTWNMLLPWFPSTLAAHALLQPAFPSGPATASCAGPSACPFARSIHIRWFRKTKTDIHWGFRSAGQLATWQVLLLVMAIGMLNPSTSETGRKRRNYINTRVYIYWLRTVIIIFISRACKSPFGYGYRGDSLIFGHMRIDSTEKRNKCAQSQYGDHIVNLRCSYRWNMQRQLV